MAYSSKATYLTIASAQSMGATFTTRGISVSDYHHCGIKIITDTSDGVGVWTVEASDNSPDGLEASSGDWVDITSGLTSIPDSASADQSIDISLPMCTSNYIRIKYTRTSGTGSATITARVKR